MGREGGLTKWERERLQERERGKGREKDGEGEKQYLREWEKEPEAVIFIAHTPGG